MVFTLLIYTYILYYHTIKFDCNVLNKTSPEYKNTFKRMLITNETGNREINVNSFLSEL